MDNKLCFMFGHRDSPECILPRIEEAIECHYANYDIHSFYVGNRGSFDHMAAAAVKRVKARHPDIRLYLLLAYHPGERAVQLSQGFDGSYYPPLEHVPRPYAIVKANRYMADCADSVICYVNHTGNTRDLLNHARLRQKKEELPIENLAENC